MSKKAIKIWLIVILTVIGVIAARHVLSMNLTGEKLFSIVPEEVDHIDMFEYGDEETVDDETCKMIVERLNRAEWTKKKAARGDGFDDTIMTIYYKNGNSEEYGFDGSYVYPLDKGHTGYYLGKDYLKDIYELVDGLVHRESYGLLEIDQQKVDKIALCKNGNEAAVDDDT